MQDKLHNKEVQLLLFKVNKKAQIMYYGDNIFIRLIKFLGAYMTREEARELYIDGIEFINCSFDEFYEAINQNFSQEEM